MKRGTPDHPKMLDFSSSMNIPIWGAVGLLEMLWHWTARYAPEGNIGKHSNAAISRGIGWTEDPDKLISGLVAARWIDEIDGVGLYVHDWDQHCEDAVHQFLARNVKYFANGVRPKLTGLNKEDRPDVSKKYDSNPFVLNTLQNMPTNAHKKPTRGAHVPLAVASAVASAVALPLPVPKPNILVENFRKSENVSTGEDLKKRRKTLKQTSDYNPIALWCDKLRIGCHVQKPTVTGQETKWLTELGNMYPKAELEAIIKAHGAAMLPIGKPWSVWDVYKNRNHWRSKAFVGIDPNSEEAINAMVLGFEQNVNPNQTLEESFGLGKRDQIPHELNGRVSS